MERSKRWRALQTSTGAGNPDLSKFFGHAYDMTATDIFGRKHGTATHRHHARRGVGRDSRAFGIGRMKRSAAGWGRRIELRHSHPGERWIALSGGVGVFPIYLNY